LDSNKFLHWFDTNQRDLPWRKTKDPYAIWVSEVMLQQTQVATVIPFWERWMQRFPTIESLANASEQEVLGLWQGLGYYRRCRLLQQGAKYVIANGYPTDAKGWQAVPGVGRYTAGAIASIAQNIVAPLVDGNVARVYARVVGDASKHEQLLKNAWIWAERNIHPERPGDWNQALMELGATVCTPSAPKCGACPVSAQCVAFRQGSTSTLPTAKDKVNWHHLQENLVVYLLGDTIGLTQSPEGEWWQGMWILPRYQDLPTTYWAEFIGRFQYTVTNHKISAEIYVIRLSQQDEIFDLTGITWMPIEELKQHPIPAPDRRALQYGKSYGIA
jgi:A/G-specific adenine glycosylase